MEYIFVVFLGLAVTYLQLLKLVAESNCYRNSSITYWKTKWRICERQPPSKFANPGFFCKKSSEQHFLRRRPKS